MPAWKDNSIYFLAETNRAIFISSRIQLTVCDPIDFLSPETHVVDLMWTWLESNKYVSPLNGDVYFYFLFQEKDFQLIYFLDDSEVIENTLSFLWLINFILKKLLIRNLRKNAVILIVKYRDKCNCTYAHNHQRVLKVSIVLQ